MGTIKNIIFNMGNSSFDKQKYETHLKCAVKRCKIYQNKTQNGIFKKKEEVVNDLKGNNEELARLKAENIIKDEGRVKVYEIISLGCQKLIERVNYLAKCKYSEVPKDMHVVLHTLIYCTDRTDIDELTEIKEQIGLKFAEAYLKRANLDKDKVVNRNVVENLGCNVPDPQVIDAKLEDIANEYGIP